MLVLKTNLSNIRLSRYQRAMINKGRGNGEANTNASITRLQAVEVKERLARGEKPIPIAEAMQITVGVVYHIRSGNTWKDVLLPLPKALLDL